MSGSWPPPEPGQGDWTSPSQPAPPPPYAGQPGGGWSTSPPPPPPYGWGQYAAPQAPRPGVIPLRPLAVGELLDGAFTTIRRYPAATLGLAAAVALVVELIQVPASYYLLHGVTTDVGSRTSTLDVITLIATLLSTVVLSGMLTVVVGQAVLGRPMTIGQAWQATKPLFWRLFGLSLLIFGIAIGIVIIGVLPGIAILIAGSTGIGVAVAFLGGFAASILDVYILTLLVFSTPALMLEKQGIRAAMSRSRTLVSGSWWRVFGIVLLASVIAEVIAGIIVVPFSIDSFTSVFSTHPSDQYRFTPLLLKGIGTLIATTLVRPFTSGLIALLYLDRRMRAEALDLTLQQAAAQSPS
jgi:hypothetical protein